MLVRSRNASYETDLDELDDELDEFDDDFNYVEIQLKNQAKEKNLPPPGEYSAEQEAQIKELAKEFLGDVKVLAKQYMEHFFKDKHLHCGGRIPKSFLFAERRISMVLNYDIIKGVERAYNVLEKEMSSLAIRQSKQSGETTDDIRLVNETLNLLARSGVPQQFAGGMMCLYLEFIEGIDIGPDP